MCRTTCYRQILSCYFCFSFIGQEIAVYRESLWHLPMSHLSNHRHLTYASNMQSSFQIQTPRNLCIQERQVNIVMNFSDIFESIISKIIIFLYVSNDYFYIFILSSQRIIRGIPADVWVAEKSSSNFNSFPSSRSQEYETVELYFSRTDWKVLVGEVNAHQSLPIGMSTFIARSVIFKTSFLLIIKIIVLCLHLIMIQIFNNFMLPEKREHLPYQTHESLRKVQSNATRMESF